MSDKINVILVGDQSEQLEISKKLSELVTNDDNKIQIVGNHYPEESEEIPEFEESFKPRKRYLGISQAIIGATFAMSCVNEQLNDSPIQEKFGRKYQPRNFNKKTPNAQIIAKSLEVIIPKQPEGTKKFIYPGFECYARTQKNADRKYNNYLKK